LEQALLCRHPQTMKSVLQFIHEKKNYEAR
jgi:hypothetical protein